MNIECIAIKTLPIFTEHIIFEAKIYNPENILDDISSTLTCSTKILVLVTQPMKFIARLDIIIEAPTKTNVTHRAFEITQYTSHKILSIDNVTYSLQARSKAHPQGGIQWTVQSILTNKMFTNLHPFISTKT